MNTLEKLGIERPSDDLSGMDYKEVRDLEYDYGKAIDLILKIADNNVGGYDFYEDDDIKAFCKDTLESNYKTIMKKWKEKK